jgi:phosphoglycolate phosphatase
MVASSHTTAAYLKSVGFDKKAYVIGNKTIVSELEAVGIKTIGSGPDTVEASLAEHVLGTVKSFDKEVGAVVVAFDEFYGFPKLFKAVNYLRNPEVKFIATNNDEKVDFPHFTFPDVGATIAAIQKVTNRKVEVISKPSKLLMETVLKHEMNREGNRFLMIGDRLNTDILFGKRHNFQTLLVGTGVHQMKDVDEILEKIKRGKGGEDDENMIPDYYVSALKNLWK